MATIRSIITAVSLKPVAIARDLGIVFLFGLGTEVDSFYGSTTALTLAQGFVMGTLANYWIPRYCQVPPELRDAYFARTLQQSIRIGCAISAILVGTSLMLLAADIQQNLGRGFLAVSAVLSPTLPILVLVGWVGNKLLADGRIVIAQLTFASPNIAFLFVLVTVMVVRLPQTPAWLVFYYWVALLLVAVLLGRTVVFGTRTEDQQKLREQFRSIGRREYATALLETASFGCLQTALVLLPGSVLTGSGAVSGIVFRVYGSLLSLVISPASQALLYMASVTGSLSTVIQAGRRIAGFGIAIALVGWIASYFMESLLNSLNAGDKWSVVIPEFVRAYTVQFAAMTLIVVSSRVLAGRALALRTSAFLGVVYAIAIVPSLAIHPARYPANYVLASSVVLLLAASALVAYALGGKTTTKAVSEIGDE